jgi:hypothetical protein
MHPGNRPISRNPEDPAHRFRQDLVDVFSQRIGYLASEKRRCGIVEGDPPPRPVHRCKPHGQTLQEMVGKGLNPSESGPGSTITVSQKQGKDPRTADKDQDHRHPDNMGPIRSWASRMGPMSRPTKMTNRRGPTVHPPPPRESAERTLGRQEGSVGLEGIRPDGIGDPAPGNGLRRSHRPKIEVGAVQAPDAVRSLSATITPSLSTMMR